MIKPDKIEGCLHRPDRQECDICRDNHIQASERQISPGKWWEGPNQEAVRVVSHKPPFVRYAQHSYDGAICKSTAKQFLSRYKPISEERATKILQHPARTTPKVVEIKDIRPVLTTCVECGENAPESAGLVCDMTQFA